MTDHTLLYSIAVIFASAAALATLAVYARQSLLVVYILLGVGLGAWGPGWITAPGVLHDIASFGIVFLLFLLGLSMHPQTLVASLRRALLFVCLSSLVFFAATALAASGFETTVTEWVLIGLSMTFSSTIVGLKLLPSSELYHQRTGELVISILLLQDLLAIVVLLFLQSRGAGVPADELGMLLLALPVLIGLAFALERWVLDKLIHRFNAIQEYVFLLALGWCLGFSALAEIVGLSAEVGAFIAGVALAASASTRFIARRLQPLRDFFLILFFFAVGADLDIDRIGEVWLPAACLTAIVLTLKPWFFHAVLRRAGEDGGVAREVGLRLGQASEFSLLVAFLAVDNGVISAHAGTIIQVATVATFVGSSFLVNRWLTTPSNPPVTAGR